jgi:putative acetyltransferase
VATDDHEPVACGAVRLIEPGTAEIKRMYVVPAARGRRIGAAVLTALEEEARTLGATRVVLETGERLTAAVALYRRAGFTPIARFGAYVNNTHSLCLEKRL